MGSSKSQSQQHYKEYQIKSLHPMLGHCKMMMASNNKLIKSSYASVGISHFQSWKKDFTRHIYNLFQTCQSEQIAKNQLSNFIFIPKHYQYLQTGYCNSNGVLDLLYEIVDDSLVNDIEMRSHSNDPYTEGSIFLFAFLLTKVAKWFHEKGEAIGDIRPENIFLSQNESYIKIATQYSWIGQKTPRDKYQSNQKIFISRAMIQCFSCNIELTRKIAFGNDDFAIGMTLAECILLEDLSKIYQRIGRELVISKEKHEKVVEDLLRIKYYPLKLLLLIVGMIQIQEDDRFTSEQICKCLNQFTTQILSHEAVKLGKSHFKRNFGKKFQTLYCALSKYKSSINSKLFTNGQLTLSNAYTINGISTVRMVKRTQNETFNIQLLDINSNISSIQYKVSQVDQNNKSWNSPDRKVNYFLEKGKRSSVLDHYHLSQIKSKKNHRSNWPELEESSVKRVTYTTPQKITGKNDASPVPITNYNSPELKIFEINKGEQNFSFHSPESRVHQEQVMQINSLNRDSKVYQSHEYLHISPEDAKSIIMANHNQPNSQQITYQYSNSNSKHQEINENTGELPFLSNIKKNSEVIYKGKQDRFKRKSLEIQRQQKRKLVYKE